MLKDVRTWRRVELVQERASGLWASSSREAWTGALGAYAEVVERQGVAGLAELDRWYREELAGVIEAREPRRVTLEELARVTEWKMGRGIWRARNLALARGNGAEVVEETSARALEAEPVGMEPIRIWTELAGVGPATASAVMAVARPEAYPFLDELVAGQVAASAGLGPVAYTLKYYGAYAEALRQRALELGSGWTPVMVERALWAHVGGKAGARAGGGSAPSARG